MIKVDIFSGFLGAGKTTLIKKLIKEAYTGEKLVLIENEFGKIGIDGGFLKESGIEITEMNSGCICCSLVGDFSKSLKEVADSFSPDRIIIEPSGVGKLSDVIKAVREADVEGLVLNACTTVIDALKCKMYMRNFEEFYRNQIEFASTVVLSRTSDIPREKLDEAVHIIREINKNAVLVTTSWEIVEGNTILSAMEKKNTIEEEMESFLAEHLKKEHHCHHSHKEDECDDPKCECHHKDEDHGHHCRHSHKEDECDDPKCECHHKDEDHGHHCHHGHKEDECDDPECECHHKDEGHGHLHAEDVFTSWGTETTVVYTVDRIKTCLNQLDTGKYGVILRAKGSVAGENGWINFDYVPGEINVRFGAADVIGKLCVIGSKLDKNAINELFAC